VTYLAREVDAQGADVGPDLAIKVLYAQRDTGSYLRRLAMEAQILQGLRHPNIVECRGFVQRDGHSPYLVTRFEVGGSLFDHIVRHGPLPVRVVAQVGRQLCWALQKAHEQGVVHRDLKPENVLQARACGRDEVPEVRVADFGIAKVTGAVGASTRVGAFVGTPQYAAPEQFLGLPPAPATDVYALGAVLLFCLTGRTLLQDAGDLDVSELREALIRVLPPRAPEVQELRGATEALLARMMTVEPAQRLSLADVEGRLGMLAEGRAPIEGTLSVNAEVDVRPHLTRQSLTRQSGPTMLPGDVDDPVPAVDRGAPPPRNAPPTAAPARGRAPLLVAAALLLAALGAGAAVWLTRDTGPMRLTGREADARLHADWSAVAGALATRSPAAIQTCKAPPGLQLEATLRADGHLAAVRVLNAKDPGLSACLARALSGTAYPRAGTGEVRVAVALP
jgi:serine/threonine protein kinase